MRRLLSVALLTAGICLAQPVVSNIRLDGSSHSVLRATWDLDMAAGYHRLRGGTTTSYEASPYGFSIPGNQNGSVSTDVQIAVSGLHDNTLYHLSPESSLDGITWSTPVDTTITTAMLPGTHPALPQAPATFDASTPSTVGYVTKTVASDCSDLTTQMQAAEVARKTTGAFLVIPTNCNVTDYYFPSASLSDGLLFTSGNVNTGTDTITITSHGMSNDDVIRFGSDVRNGPPPSGLDQTLRYYVCNATMNTFQVCTGTGGVGVVSLVTTGTGGQLVIDMTTESIKEVIVVPAASFIVPLGVRAQYGKAKFTLNTLGTAHTGIKLQEGLHHWRFTGIEVTTAVTPESPTTTMDPTPYGKLIDLASDTDHIIFERAYVHGQGYPSRTAEGMYTQGSHFAFIDSTLDNIDSWHGANLSINDFNASVSGAVLTITTGIYMLGYQNCTLANPATATITGGSASGTGRAYWDMSCVLHVVLPTGMTANCVNCTFSTAASPAFPLNGSGNTAAGRIANLVVTSGAWTSADSNTFKANQGGSSAYGEGPTGLLLFCGGGSGPNIIRNSKIETQDIGVHAEDSCTVAQMNYPKADITIQRNLFTLRSSWVPTNAAFDFKFRPSRNLLEFKQVGKMLANGNIFENQFTSITPQAYGLIVFQTKGAPPRRGQVGTQMTDIDITNNLFRNVSSGIQVVGGIEGSPGIPMPLLRSRIQNNSIQVNANNYDPTERTTGALGFAMNFWGPMEDHTVNHNTAIASGSAPRFWYQIDSMIEGFSIKNGIYVIEDPTDKRGASFELDCGIYPCGTILPATLSASSQGKALLDAVGVEGAGNPSYNFLDNVLVPWNSANAVNWNTVWTGAGSAIECASNCAGSTAAQRVAAVQFVDFANGNYRLLPSSPYHNTASDGTDRGANIDTVNDAVGMISGISSTTTGNTLTATAHVPDVSVSCYVAYGISTDPSTWLVSSANTSASQTRTITATGLQQQSLYNYQIWCNGSGPSATMTDTTLAVGSRISVTSRSNVTGRQ